MPDENVPDEEANEPSLVDFLLARFDEDHSAARAHLRRWEGEAYQRRRRGIEPVLDALNEGALNLGDRVAADTWAKRRIVDRYRWAEEPGAGQGDTRLLGHAWSTLLDLASAYAHHPDWRPEWQVPTEPLADWELALQVYEE